MSVPVPLRAESKVKFVDASFDLYIKSLDNARRLPKSLTFYLSVPLVNAAERCMADCKKANSIFPDTRHKAQRRMDKLEEAQGSVQEIYSLFTVLSTMMPIEREDKPQFGKDGKRKHQRKAITERSLELWLEAAQTEAKAIAKETRRMKEIFKSLKD